MPRTHVLGSAVHHVEMGTGRTVVFLHGNPASSYIWRRILPEVGPGRLLAPDLIGMGSSGQPDLEYSFADHACYLDAWFDEQALDDVVLVGHDWGGALAFDWAARHPGRTAGVAFFESVVRPLAEDEVSPGARARARLVRTPGDGERFVLESDDFVSSAFRAGVVDPVTERDLSVYLTPFPTPRSRRPILAWARQLPFGDVDPARLGRLESYQPWLRTSPEVPKLLVTFEGSATLLVRDEMVAWCRANVAGLEVVPGGIAGHHAQEDQPVAIGKALSGWLDRHGLR